MKTQKRKLDHLHVCLTKDVQSGKSNGFDRFELMHDALPEIDREEVNDVSTEFLGHRFAAPLFISAMTGGTKEALRINQNLAKAAQHFGIGMGVGSQRAMIENPELASTFQVRDVAPDIFLVGNIGAAQIMELGPERINEALVSIGADGLAIHLNVAQEIAQDDGHERWKGMLEAIGQMKKQARGPVIVKEVGCGISGKVAKKLQDVGVDAIDVAGAGGTSWVKVDSLITGKPLHNFFDWGLPTAECLAQCLSEVKVPVIASGGIRNGVEVAKAMAMGASLAGMALPLLKPATKSAASVGEIIEHIIMELHTAMFFVSARNLSELRGKITRM